MGFFCFQLYVLMENQHENTCFPAGFHRESADLSQSSQSADIQAVSATIIPLYRSDFYFTGVASLFICTAETCGGLHVAYDFTGGMVISSLYSSVQKVCSS
jgi:hypothetical protein